MSFISFIMSPMRTSNLEYQAFTYGKTVTFLLIIVVIIVISNGLASTNLDSQASANRGWPGNPTINIPICTNPSYQDYPTIVRDGSGGAIITWQDFRNGNYDIYAQRVSSEGVVQWEADGVPICTDLNSQSLPIIISDGSNGAIITWRDLRNGNADIYAQLVNSKGVIQWEIDGVPICTAVNDQSSHTVVSDGSGGAIIVWEDYRSNINFDIYAQRVDSDGDIQWEIDGVSICTAVNDQYSSKVVSDGFGGVIIAWEDKRSNNGDI